MTESQLNDLFTVLRFASVSTDPAYKKDILACAQWIFNKLKSIGLDAKLNETKGHPIITAKNQHKPGRKTVLIYGHYDVQPVDPVNEWRHNPFEPVIENGKIICRGSADNKGQFMSHICGIEQALKENAGELPVNIILLLEGEEECGSTHLVDFLEKNKDYLKCDIIVVSDTGMIAEGVGTLTYSMRGIVAAEIIAHGPKEDLHSGMFGGSIANPATAIARLVASFHDQDGRIQVLGFYDDVLEIQDWERNQWLEFGDTGAELKNITGTKDLFGEKGYSDLERRWARPTAELNGIGGGYQGEGGKTVIPRKAFAKMTFRMVPNQNPDKIQEAIRAHIQKNCLPGVHFEVTHERASSAYLMDPNSYYGQIAVRVLEKTFNKKPALIREGGSIPIVNEFKKVLGVDTLLLGLALQDCGAHAPNENFPIANFEAGIRLNEILLQELAKN